MTAPNVARHYPFDRDATEDLDTNGSMPGLAELVEIALNREGYSVSVTAHAAGIYSYLEVTGLPCDGIEAETLIHDTIDGFGDDAWVLFPDDEEPVNA